MIKYLTTIVLATALVLGLGLPALAGNPTPPPPPLPADQLVLTGAAVLSNLLILRLVTQ